MPNSSLRANVLPLRPTLAPAGVAGPAPDAVFECQYVVPEPGRYVVRTLGYKEHPGDPRAVFDPPGGMWWLQSVVDSMTDEPAVPVSRPDLRYGGRGA